MKKKIIIIASVIGLVFVFALLLFGGASTTSTSVTQKEVTKKIEKIVCEIDGENDLEYQMEILSNDIQFDSELKFKSYKKLNIIKKSDLKIYGVAFVVKSSSNGSISLSLNKNTDVLTTCALSVKGGEVGYVDLILEQAEDISVTDDLYISITSQDDFIFDTILFFFEA